MDKTKREKKRENRAPTPQAARKAGRRHSRRNVNCGEARSVSGVNARFSSENKRNKMIAKIHIGKKYLGLSEDDYRVFLKASCGKESTKEMNINELQEVLNSMSIAGAFMNEDKKYNRNTNRHFYVSYQDTKYLSERQVKYIKSLWWKKANYPSEETLKLFIKRITGKKSLSECGHNEANILITAIQEIKK